MSKKILIIGSGIAGIAASLKLKSYGLESTIVDKGNFIGGRIGTREEKVGKNTYYFFHDAQFFTAKSNNFKKVINLGIKEHYIKKFGDFSPPRFRGFPTMRNFLSNISKNINIQQNCKITGLKKINKKISALDEKSKSWNVFDAVISTIPAPQNLELMKNFPVLKQSLKTASYDACMALMFYFDEYPLKIPDLKMGKSSSFLGVVPFCTPPFLLSVSSIKSDSWIGNPAGHPSIVMPTQAPCDSPKICTRNKCPKVFMGIKFMDAVYL